MECIVADLTIMLALMTSRNVTQATQLLYSGTVTYSPQTLVYYHMTRLPSGVTQAGLRLPCAVLK
jgi:lactate dehydrogenase-like 2-hydroxyacid dehydrogenase